ncbi:unnamed protein product [Caenorhabditis angaria]|uniref:JmjC domain-containing protein n=1 Tax=Caenorhabditis angaria TaxID=860376 RepID=A0A9P1J1A1_9PELO|nr:unnamed protein product [Caenorhabditis angaria]
MSKISKEDLLCDESAIIAQSDIVKKEERDNDAELAKPVYDLPPTFSLLAPINVEYNVSSQEILSMSAERTSKSPYYLPVFDENVPAPQAPFPPTIDNVSKDQSQLLKPVPILEINSQEDLQFLALKLQSAPITLIKNLTSTLEMDLSLFSSEKIAETAGATKIEIRLQNCMPIDVNIDNHGKTTWNCESVKKSTTIAKYAQYQAEIFQNSPKDEEETLRKVGSKCAQQMADDHGGKRKKTSENVEKKIKMNTIKFGTNVDLSNEIIWKEQIREIAKMPTFCQITHDENMLSHLDHTIFGMNTVQFYMKVPGSRTPAHQENNSIASININVGPGNCEWFGCAYEYWGVVEALCKKNCVNFLSGSWWPNMEELLEANVPVYQFTQKAGDMVWVDSGCVHWVQATGCCNNISWNVAPLNHTQLSIAIQSYEWNKLSEYRSLVPIQQLAWKLAKNVHFSSQEMYDLVRGVLIRSLSFSKIVYDFAVFSNKELIQRPREEKEGAHYCKPCQVEVFNILFVKKVKSEYLVHCVYCAKKGGLSNFVVLQQYLMSELAEIFDGMVLKPTLNNSLAQ